MVRRVGPDLGLASDSVVEPGCRGSGVDGDGETEEEAFEAWGESGDAGEKAPVAPSAKFHILTEKR